MNNILATISLLTNIILAIGALFVAIRSTKKEIEETLPKKIKNQCPIDIEITNRLEEVKEYLKADRVQIYDFHNRSGTMQMGVVLLKHLVVLKLSELA